MTALSKAFYLSRLDLYEKEKPYMFTFQVPDNAGPQTNHSYEPHQVAFHDVRENKDIFHLNTHGFQFFDWDTALESSDFDDLSVVQTTYSQEVVDNMYKILPASHKIEVLTHLRRKRSALFPGVETDEPEYANPIVYAHTDFSPHGAQVAVDRFIAKDESLRGRPFDIINVWRVTSGPNDDWPLALCDFTSVDKEDIEFSDVIHRDKLGESVRLYHNPQHRWHYLSDQDVSECVVFRNASSKGLDVPFAAHLAFEPPKGKTNLTPRESIEMRLVCFY